MIFYSSFSSPAASQSQASCLRIHWPVRVTTVFGLPPFWPLPRGKPLRFNVERFGVLPDLMYHLRKVISSQLHSPTARVWEEIWLDIH